MRQGSGILRTSLGVGRCARGKAPHSAGMAVLAWLIAWGILYLAWKDRTTGLGAKFVACLILIALGAVGTFLPFFLHFRH